MQVLLLSNGMTAPSLNEALVELKKSSTAASTHKQREFYWDAYGRMISAISGRDDRLFGFLSYRGGGEEAEGRVAFDEFTGKQKQMLASTKPGALEILGKKFRPPDDPGAKEWFSCWFGDEAQAALDDVTCGEPVIYISTESVFVGTRLKRKMVRGGPSVKTLKDMEKFISELEPEKPLQSVAWRGNHPPNVNEYNVILAGPWGGAIICSLPPTIGYVENLSPNDIYRCFRQRRNQHLVGEAEKLIDRMLADVQKGETKPLIEASSMKHAAAARENSLMKVVYVHESKGRFVDKIRHDGSEVEMHVIEGDIQGTKFGEYGGIVFELFYRTDLGMFM